MMDKLRAVLTRKLPSGSFARNVLTLMTGTTFAQIITIIAAPVLTRLYTPEDFGIFALYTSILSILAVISCLRYEQAIVLPEKEEAAANLLVICVLICSGMAVMILLLVSLFHTRIADILGAPELAHWLWLMPLSLLAIGLFQALNYWSTRRRQFKRLAVRQITRSTATFVSQIGIGTIYPSVSAGGLIGGDLIGQFFATGRLAWEIGKEEGRKILHTLQWNSAKQVFLRFKIFPLYSSWASLLNTVSAMLPALLLGFFFTPTVVGFFSLANRVLAMPIGVIGSSLAQVFFPEATASYRHGTLNQITLKMFKQLVSLGTVPILLLTIVAPDLFNILFGHSWIVAGKYVRWLSLWIFFQFISSPISTVYVVLEKQKDFLLFNILLLVTRIIALVIGGINNDAMLSIILFGTSGFVMYLFFTIRILTLAGIRQVEFCSIIGFEIFKSLPYALVPIALLYLFDNVFLYVLSAILAGLVFLIRISYTSIN